MLLVIIASSKALERFHLHSRVDAVELDRVGAEGTLGVIRENGLIGVNRVIAHCISRDYWLQPAICIYLE